MHFSDSKSDVLVKHLLTKCDKVPVKDRDELLALEAAKAEAVAEPTIGSRKQAKSLASSNVKSGAISSFIEVGNKLTTEQAKQLDSKLCRWLVVAGVPFAAVDSEFFLDFVSAVRPAYIPAGMVGRLLHFVSTRLVW